MGKPQAAQNQHYVPKFILRQFLSDEKKERVSVFRKTTRCGFVTSIDNIMAERRFYEFQVQPGYLASFEDAACRIEDIVLPVYRALLERRKLSDDPEEKAHLAVLFAFQMLRTRAYRDHFSDMVQQIRNKWGAIEDIDAELPKCEDEFKNMHLESIRKSIGEFADIIATKDFLLYAASEGRSFYLADDPVALHNDIPRQSIFSNIGLAVEGIQIYLPLSSDLMLAAWCPSLRNEMEAKARESLAHQRRVVSSAVMSPQFMSRINKIDFDRQLAEMRRQQAIIDERLHHIRDGTPVPLLPVNMDFYNTMQVGAAREFIICQRGDFELAGRFMGASKRNNKGVRVATRSSLA